jgi:ADP-glucose pyrophosphorylase
MSPPEVWGPPVWTLFHTLIEKLNPNAYNQVIPSMFGMIKQICKMLPCPECSKDASNFLAKLKLSDFKNKTDFKNMLYLFHNYVNAKKRKPLYNYANIDKYANLNLIHVINNFIINYNTKGNMNLLAESFQRQLIIKNFKIWFNGFRLAFINHNFSNIVPHKGEVQESTVQETIIKEESTVQETLVEEEKVIEEESAVQETIIKEEYNVQETVIEEESAVQETIIKEETTVQETLVEEEKVIEQDNKIEEFVE